MKLDTTPTADFSDEQKRYLEGFMSGMQVGRVGRAFAAGGASVANAQDEMMGPPSRASGGPRTRFDSPRET